MRGVAGYRAGPRLLARDAFHQREIEGQKGKGDSLRSTFEGFLVASELSVCSIYDCRRWGFFPLQTRSERLVDAERFLIEIVAGCCIGAGAATHTDIAELAATALSLQV